MSSLQYFDYEGFGERSKKDLNYSQAVRIDNRIEISGQGPSTPLLLLLYLYQPDLISRCEHAGYPVF